ncbi:MAG: thioesterase domain-containing protein [Verrucomicrobiota bacterium]|nr:thioesterase domain-containing protein [Verrucomicrobiota bacterium]
MSSDQRLRETEKFLHEQIPLTRAMEIGVESNGHEGFILRAPLPPNHNHLGTAFGGSLAAIVLLSGYGLLWLELNDRTAHLVVSESRMKFRRPVRSDLRAICRRPEAAALSRFTTDFATKGKARIQLEARIEEEGETAVLFEGTYVALR